MEKTIDEQLTSMRSTLWRQRVFNVVLVCTVVVAALSPSYFPQFGPDATFNTVNCKTWNVIDANGNLRISATTTPDGSTSMTWLDKDGKPRIGATIAADGNAGMTLFDKDMNLRMSAGTFANGNAGMTWFDKDGNSRITASTAADSTVTLPTTDLKLKP